MPTGPFTITLDESGVSFTLRVWKAGSGWTWSGNVGGKAVRNEGAQLRSADAAQAFGESACREVARERLSPQAHRARLELELVQAQQAYDMAVAAAARLENPPAGKSSTLFADARTVQRIADARSRIDQLKAELDSLSG